MRLHGLVVRREEEVPQVVSERGSEMNVRLARESQEANRLAASNYSGEEKCYMIVRACMHVCMCTSAFSAQGP